LTASSKKLNIKVLDKNEEKLVYEVCKSHIDLDKDKIFLKPLERIGTRATKMFIVNFQKGSNKTCFFILKIYKEKEIRTEYDRWFKYIHGMIPPISLLDEPKYINGLGAILYNHTGGFTQEQIAKSMEFNDLLISNKYPIKKKLKILDLLYDKEMNQINKYAKIGSCSSLKKEYNDYLHPRTSEKIMNSLLESVKDNEYFDLYGYKIYNPLKFLNDFRGFRQKTKIKKKNLHGDLHPRNIIIDYNFKPRLVDFEWAHRGHSLKDYVILEASIKFFQIKRTFPLNKCLDFEKHLINFDNFEDIDNFISEKGDKLLRDSYKLITHIRDKALDFCIWKNKKLEYLCALFLVSYGLFSIPKCYSQFCMGSLGLIAEKLNSSNLGDLKP
jgi:hypothetical protein